MAKYGIRESLKRICPKGHAGSSPAPGTSNRRLLSGGFVVALCNAEIMYERTMVDRALALSRQGITDREVARTCGVSIGAIRHWRYGTRRDKPEGRRKHDCPRCDGRALDRRSYAYLLGIYLGDGHIAQGSKGVYRLEIACDSGWPGLIDVATEVIKAVFPSNAVGRRIKGCTMVGVSSKHLPCLFPQHGPGMKHTRKIELETWQEEIVTEFAEEFIRGLIHSDGCRGMNRVRRGERWYEYPRYFFTNASDDIRQLFTDALDRLGVEWKQSNKRVISVARKEAVARLDEFVGPKY
jgi:hypothetical protein